MFLECPEEYKDKNSGSNKVSFYHLSSKDGLGTQVDGYNCGMIVVLAVIHTLVSKTTNVLPRDKVTANKLSLLRNNWALLIKNLSNAMKNRHTQEVTDDDHAKSIKKKKEEDERKAEEEKKKKGG